MQSPCGRRARATSSMCSPTSKPALAPHRDSHPRAAREPARRGRIDQPEIDLGRRVGARPRTEPTLLDDPPVAKGYLGDWRVRSEPGLGGAEASGGTAHSEENGSSSCATATAPEGVTRERQREAEQGCGAGHLPDHEAACEERPPEASRQGSPGSARMRRRPAIALFQLSSGESDLKRAASVPSRKCQ